MSPFVAFEGRLLSIRVQLDVLNDDAGILAWLAAYTTGERWNGWATPLFDKAAADRLVALFEEKRVARGAGTRAWYDAEGDLYAFQDEDGELEEFGATDAYGPKLYPIGSHVWTWSADGDYPPMAGLATGASKK